MYFLKPKPKPTTIAPNGIVSWGSNPLVARQNGKTYNLMKGDTYPAAISNSNFPPMDPHRDVIRVWQAWNDAGRHPPTHYAQQRKLRREWPELASALDGLRRR